VAQDSTRRCLDDRRVPRASTLGQNAVETSTSRTLPVDR
jgi:hypothetical protein